MRPVRFLVVTLLISFLLAFLGFPTGAAILLSPFLAFVCTRSNMSAAKRAEPRIKRERRKLKRQENRLRRAEALRRAEGLRNQTVF